jgi:ribosomal protein S18 acetylase RimI-like enzyme
MAEYKNTIVGCFSLLPHKNNNYELGKMAIDVNYHGLQFGQKLVSFAIEFAKEQHWETITLYSSSKLPTALHIYRKYGFRDVELEKNLPYERSDVKMELSLK